MIARFYIDVDIDERQFVKKPLVGKEGEDPEQPVTDGHFEGMRYLSWVLCEYLEGKKPSGYEGPEVFIKELHAEYVYPDPSGTIIFGEEDEDEDQGTERPEGSMEQHSPSDSCPTDSK